MSNYHHKYLKYKSKYILLKGGSKRNFNEMPILNGDSHNYNKNFNFDKLNLNRQKLQKKIKCIDINDIKIPESYKTGSLLFKANGEFINDPEFTKYTNDFEPKNSTLLMDESAIKNFVNGIFEVKLKDGAKYNLEVVPFLIKNEDTLEFYWPWILSGYNGLPAFDKKIAEFKNQYNKYINQVPHLKFDCMNAMKGETKTDLMLYDILLFTKYLLNSKGLIKLVTPKIPNIKEFVSFDFFMVTKITKM